MLAWVGEEKLTEVPKKSFKYEDRDGLKMDQ